MATTDDLERYRGYMDEEVDGVYLYEQLAEIEEDESLSDIYRRLASVEARHLDLWRQELQRAGADAEPGKPSLRARTLIWVARRFGPELVVPVIKSLETGAADMYLGEPIAESAGMHLDEQSHSRVFRAISDRRGVPGSVIGRLEVRHRSLGGGNALRAAVLGANDGLVSNFALVMGFAGADPGQATVVLAGIAGLLAGASSMALGEWISVTSSREAAEAQLAIEEEELALMPEAEQEELALIYQAKGLPAADAEQLAERLMQDRETALGTLAREELGIVPEDLGSPWAASIASFILFAIGAVIPVVPFFLTSGAPAILGSTIASGIGLFLLGAAITLLTGRGLLFAGTRQVVLGLAAATLTFAIGALIGEVAAV